MEATETRPQLLRMLPANGGDEVVKGRVVTAPVTHMGG
jgi:hypothetical protein